MDPPWRPPVVSQPSRWFPENVVVSFFVVLASLIFRIESSILMAPPSAALFTSKDLEPVLLSLKAPPLMITVDPCFTPFVARMAPPEKFWSPFAFCSNFPVDPFCKMAFVRSTVPPMTLIKRPLLFPSKVMLLNVRLFPSFTLNIWSPF